MIVIVLRALSTPLIRISQTSVYKTSTKASEYTSIERHHIIWIFIYYLHYQTHNNDNIGDDHVNVTKN